MKKLKTKLNSETVYFTACLFILLLVFITPILITNNREWFDRQAGRVTVTESEETSVVNLCVVKKVWRPGPTITSFFGRHYLVLSNDMIIDVSMREFEEYEENQYYDFELAQKTTVSRKLSVRKE